VDLSDGKLNAIDLFSGYGGITVALSKYARPVVYCEKERYAQAILLSRMEEGKLPAAPIWDDVSTFDGKPYKGKIDIIYGGFPCQGISQAGRGEGLEDERSGLFFELLRVATEAAPGFIFLENVPAIRTRGLREVVVALAEVGYDCRWTCITASYVGAPHKRERWFLLGHATDAGLSSRRSIEMGKSQTLEESERPGAVANAQGIDGGGGVRGLPEEDAAQRRSEDLHQSEAEQPECPGEDFPVLADTEDGGGESSQRQGGQGTGRRSFDFCGNQEKGRVCDMASESVSLPEPRLGGDADGSAGRVDESESSYIEQPWQEGWEDGIERTTEVKEHRTNRIKALGNGVVPQQVRFAFEYLLGMHPHDAPGFVEYEEMEW